MFDGYQTQKNEYLRHPLGTMGTPPENGKQSGLYLPDKDLVNRNVLARPQL